MSMKDSFDREIEGQMDISDLYNPDERLIAVSRIFARARKEMSLAEQKTFVYALSELKFKENPKTSFVYLDKKKLAAITGINTDSNHLSFDLNKQIKELPIHSFIEISKEDKELFDSGTVITRVTMLKNRVRIKFEEEYLQLFTGLSANYITMWTGDIFKMTTKRAVQLYEYLRQNTDTRKQENDIGLGVKSLKEILNIPKEGKGSYIRGKDGFDRANFERYVIDPLCADIAKCKMITLIMQPDGKYYEKVKRGNRVLGYRFHWTFSAYPKVASAAEVKQLQERVDKNPQVLKVAKDIVKGEKKKETQPRKTRFHNFQERHNDYDAIERQFLQRQGMTADQPDQKPEKPKKGE